VLLVDIGCDDFTVVGETLVAEVWALPVAVVTPDFAVAPLAVVCSFVPPELVATVCVPVVTISSSKVV
jgi:hypothetical protein